MRRGGVEPPKALSHEMTYISLALSLTEERHLKSRAFDHFATPALLERENEGIKDYAL